MEWLEVSVRVNGEAAEAVAEVLSRYAPQGVAIDIDVDDTSVRQTDLYSSLVTVKAYLPVDDAIHERRRQVAAGIGHLRHIWPVIPEPVFRPVPDQDWTALWKEQIPILRLGRRVLIKPTWRAYAASPDDVVLEMDPGMAFGTGLHPTTRLCVEAAEILVQPDDAVLDLGTGTGILAMVAARLGAGTVVAIDNDVDAVVTARQNIARNGLSERITVTLGSLGDVGGSFDLVLANILAPVIITMAQAGIVERVRRGGRLVASGILNEQTASVVTALVAAGLRVRECPQHDGWVALIAERP